MAQHREHRPRHAESESFTHDVFLSHSAHDNAVVRELAARLRADGVRVWFDEWEIKLGDSIFSKVEAGLQQSRVLVLCISEHAVGSDWAALERQTSRFRDPLNWQRRFIALRLDDAPSKTPSRKCVLSNCCRKIATKILRSGSNSTIHQLCHPPAKLPAASTVRA